MDADDRGFDATLAFLAEFQDVAVAAYGADDYNLPELVAGYAYGRPYHDATLDATTIKGNSKAGPCPVVQQPMGSGSRPTQKCKAPLRKAVRGETNGRAETTTRSGIAETVTTVKPLSRKDEIAFLREQVVELEKTLYDLKRSGREAARRYSHTLEAESTGGGPMALEDAARKAKRIPSMWEELAKRQSKQRQSAQIENLKLKTKLDDQLKLAASLQRLLKRSTTDELLRRKTAKTPE